MKITKSQLKQIIKEEISITELESWATEELEPVINQVLQRLGVVEKKLKIDPSMAVIKEKLGPEMGSRQEFETRILSELRTQTVLLRQISVALNAGADVP